MAYNWENLKEKKIENIGFFLPFTEKKPNVEITHCTTPRVKFDPAKS